MPMPVSVTSNASCGSPVDGARLTFRPTRPALVNLTAFDSRLASTWRSRCRSVNSADGTSEAISTPNSSFFSAASGPNTLRRSSARPASVTCSGWTSIRPASALDRSRMSLMSCSRSEPEE